MANVVVTLLGDDRAGLVGALAGVVTKHGGNWEKSHMAELAGKFAGIVLVTAPSSAVEALAADLEALETEGLFEIQVELASDAADASATTAVVLELVGQDHPGIVYDVSQALASRNVSIDELETEIEAAPMGGKLFKARAVLEVPKGVSLEDLNETLEDIAQDLMVDLRLVENPV